MIDVMRTHATSFWKFTLYVGASIVFFVGLVTILQPRTWLPNHTLPNVETKYVQCTVKSESGDGWVCEQWEDGKDRQPK